jgi:hypothetical protein
MGTGSFPGVKYGRGVLLTTLPLLVPWSWKSRAIPTHPLGHTGPVTGLLYLYIVGSVECKRRNIKIMYSQNGVSLANERLKHGWSSHVLLDELEDRH